MFGSGKMEDPSQDPLTLSYNGITAALTKAVQQLKMMFDEIIHKVDEIINRLDAQDKEIKLLKEAIRQQQNIIDSLGAKQ